MNYVATLVIIIRIQFDWRGLDALFRPFQYCLLESHTLDYYYAILIIEYSMPEKNVRILCCYNQ